MMIDKISDIKIRETVIEETTQEQEPQAQDSAEIEPLVQATPEFKSGLIAEQRLEGQMQELLLNNQLNSQIPSEDSKKSAAQNDVRQPTFSRPTAPSSKSVPEFVSETVKQIPDQLNRKFGEIGEALSDPVAVINDAAEEAKRRGMI